MAEKLLECDSGLNSSKVSFSKEEGGRALSEMPKTYPTLAVYAGVFLASASTLLFELSLTRIFAVVLWAHLAFMVVASAMFGFGLSGVFLALTNRPSQRRMSLASLAVMPSLSILAAYAVMSFVPLEMWRFSENPLNYLYLAVWYTACVVPFFIAGQILARLLSDHPLRCSRIYGVDLIGAAVGALLLVPLIPLFGGVGLLVLSALLAAVASLVLEARGNKKWRVAAYMEGRPRTADSYLLWNPLNPSKDNIYGRIIRASAEEQREFYTALGVNLFPATDDSPFAVRSCDLCHRADSGCLAWQQTGSKGGIGT